MTVTHLNHQRFKFGRNESVISSFPTEILLLIFNELYAASIDGTFASYKHNMCVQLRTLEDEIEAPFQCNCSKEEKAIVYKWNTTTEDEISEVLFPYAVAQVSQQWLQILESRPEYWTRIVVFLDAKPHSDDTPLPTIARQLELSRCLELQQFYVMRHSYTAIDTEEYGRCRDIIEALIPHVHRCHLVSFNTLASSSLPSVGRDFHGSAPNLKFFKLKAHFDDRRITETDRGPNRDFLCPKLGDVSIDRQNFVDWCLNSSLNASITTTPDAASIVKICLSNFSPAASDNFTLSDLCRCLGNLYRLKTLEFDNCMFQSDDELPALGTLPPIMAQEVRLKNLPASYMHALQTHVDFDSVLYLSVDNCQLSDTKIQATILPANTVWIDNIPPTPTADGLDHMSMVRYFSRWEGNSLDITNCPTFNDLTLDMIERDVGVDFQISITDCEGWTVQGLQRLIFRLQPTDDDAQFAPEGSVSDVEVRGWGPPKPNNEEMKWLKDHVADRFIWEAKERNLSH